MHNTENTNFMVSAGSLGTILFFESEISKSLFEIFHEKIYLLQKLIQAIQN
jgi:hypothetical protein